MNWIKKLFSKEKREMNQSVNTDEEPNHIEGDFTIFNKLESIFEDLPVVSTNGKEQLVNKFKRKIIDYGGFIAPIDGCSEILRSGLKGIAEVRKQMGDRNILYVVDLFTFKDFGLIGNDIIGQACVVLDNIAIGVHFAVIHEEKSKRKIGFVIGPDEFPKLAGRNSKFDLEKYYSAYTLSSDIESFISKYDDWYKLQTKK